METPAYAAILARLRDALDRGSLAHALLFTGIAGSGTREAAESLAASALGLADTARLAAHPDFSRLARAENADEPITVEEVRALRSRLSLTSSLGGRKVALIERVELLNGGAASAFLKTLEEPGGDTILLMTAERPGGVLATIRSRAARVALPPPPADAAEAGMTGELAEEYARVYRSIADTPYALRFKFAETVAKHPEKQRAFLHVAASEARRDLAEAARAGKMLGRAARRAKAVLVADALLTRTNASPRLILDTLLLQAS